MGAGTTILAEWPKAACIGPRESAVQAMGRDRPSCPPPTPSGMRAPAVLAAAALHIAVAASFVLAFRAREMAPAADTGTPLVFVPAAPGPLETKPELVASGTLPPPTSRQVAETLSPLQPLYASSGAPGIVPKPSHFRSHARAAPALRPAGNEPSAAATQAATAPVPRPAGTAPASPPLAPSPELAQSMARQSLANWEARIRQAVQDAAVYPAASRMLRREGSAQVQFDYEKGSVARASIAQTSRTAALDNAALAAVLHARLPEPPPGIGTQKRTLLVWVQFRLVSED